MGEEGEYTYGEIEGEPDNPKQNKRKVNELEIRLS
tara:strand:+ start:15649 stop:15753 length:105 start_codon:yes stop_codon:yes gene_type:complete